MHVVSISGAAFMAQSFEYRLPARGVVLVHGENGAGKSARFVDAICYALWGKTERGIDPWSAKPGAVICETDTFTIYRRWTGKTMSVRLIDKDGTTTFPTNTAATQEVIRRYMTLDAWKLCARLTSNDIAAFSKAAASKELSMIEAILGLAWIKRAATLAEQRARAAKAAYLEAQATQTLRETELQGIERGLQVASRLLGSTPTPPASADPSESALAALREKATPTYAPTNLLRVPQRQQGVDHVYACETCGRPYPVLSRSNAPAQQLQSPELASALGHSVGAVFEPTEAQASTAREALAEALRVREGWVSYRAAVQYRERAIRDLKLEEESDRMLDVCLQLVAARLDLSRAQAQAATAATVHQLFRPGGVREVLLEQTLSALAATATRYVHAMGLSAQIHMALASGRVSFAVTGVGGEHGYDGASSGQRRRIDIAMAFAMADSSQYGRQALWVDEVFDSLDINGTEQVVELLQSMAQHRQVILLTHNHRAIETLIPTAAMTVHLQKTSS
jgi:energy-coupling factor transporter ATP-binding protein EcfA2